MLSARFCQEVFASARWGERAGRRFGARYVPWKKPGHQRPVIGTHVEHMLTLNSPATSSRARGGHALQTRLHTLCIGLEPDPRHVCVRSRKAGVPPVPSMFTYITRTVY